MQNIFKEVKSEVQFQIRTDVNYLAHIHEDIEIIFVKQGSVTAFCDGQKYILGDNTLFLVSPYQVHHYTNSVEGEYIVLVIKASAMLRYGEILSGGIPKNAAVSIDYENKAIRALYLAFEEYILNGYNGITEGYLTVFLGKMLGYFEFVNDRTSNDNVRKILEYCIEHYHENITVSRIAEELGVSRSCISHIFSSRFAINFCDYINSLRLIDSVQLLKNRALSITDIALISGFSNLRTFNRAFLKQYGISPTVYRSTIYYKK